MKGYFVPIKVYKRTIIFERPLYIEYSFQRYIKESLRIFILDSIKFVICNITYTTVLLKLMRLGPNSAKVLERASVFGQETQ